MVGAGVVVGSGVGLGEGLPDVPAFETLGELVGARLLVVDGLPAEVDVAEGSEVGEGNGVVLLVRPGCSVDAGVGQGTGWGGVGMVEGEGGGGWGVGGGVGGVRGWLGGWVVWGGGGGRDAALAPIVLPDANSKQVLAVNSNQCKQ